MTKSETSGSMTKSETLTFTIVQECSLGLVAGLDRLLSSLLYQLLGFFAGFERLLPRLLYQLCDLLPEKLSEHLVHVQDGHGSRQKRQERQLLSEHLVHVQGCRFKDSVMGMAHVSNVS